MLYRKTFIYATVVDNLVIMQKVFYSNARQMKRDYIFVYDTGPKVK